MATQTTAPRSTRPTSLTPERPSLASIIKTGNGLPNRYVMHAVEGFGKTSFAAQCPKPIFIQSRGETGIQTLIDANRIKETPYFPEAQNWMQFLGCIETLIEEPHEYRTLAIDTLNGAERLCHEHVCMRDFSGDWSDKGFASYQKGPEVALSEWRLFLSLLDRLRTQKRMTIFILCHTKVAPFRNPLGADFDRYQPDVDKRTWSLTSKWCDAILFCNFDAAVSAIRENKKTGEQKGKGSGGKIRMMYTEHDAAYDAKNRLGLAPEIDMGESAAEAFKNFMEAVKAGRETVAQ